MTRAWSARPVAFALICAVAGCGSQSEAPQSFSIDTLASGALLARNSKVGAPPGYPSWRIVEDVRLGSERDGDGFGAVGAVAIDVRGRFYVLDRLTQRIRVFGADGEYVRDIGRKGKGPGEFEDAVGFAWDRDGRLWVVDHGNARYAVFDTAGHLVGTHERLIVAAVVPWPGLIDTTGQLFDVAAVPGTVPPQLFLIRASRDLATRDTVPLPHSAPLAFTLRRGNVWLTANIPFAPSLSWLLDRGGNLWFATTDAYRVFHLDSAGDTVLIIEMSHDPVPVSDEERDSAVAGLEWFTRQGGAVDRSRIPARKPAVERLAAVDDQGRLWVMPAAKHDDPGTVFDVFDGQGRFVGRAEAAFHLSRNVPVVIHGEFVYAVSTDSTGAEQVVRGRIIRSSR